MEPKQNNRSRKVEAIDVDTDYELKHNSRRRRVEAIDVVNKEDIRSDNDIKQSNNVVRKIPSPVKIMPGLSRQELEHLAVILACGNSRIQKNCS